MTEPRRCKWEKCGGPIPTTARADADFCRPEHKSAHHNEQRRSQGTTAKRLDPASGPENGPSADVHQLFAARDRQPTDAERLLTALRVRGEQGIHSHEIRKRFISGNPSARVEDLEALGFEIQHTREHKGRRPGVRYVLLAEPGQLTEAA